MNEMIELSPHSISRSTLHTNLKTMEKLGVLVSFNHENETHYELNQDLHVNVIQNDGNIQDIKDPEVEEHLIIVKDLIQKKHGKIKKFTILAELY